MRRQIGVFVFIAQLLLSAPIHGFAQQTPAQPIPDGVLGSQLIAWSQLQQPEPVLQGQSREQRQSQPLGQASNSAQTFTDCTNTDCPDNHRSGSIPGVMNRADRSVDKYEALEHH